MGLIWPTSNAGGWIKPAAKRASPPQNDPGWFLVAQRSRESNQGKQPDCGQPTAAGPVMTPLSPVQMVAEFHRAFGLPVRAEPDIDIPEPEAALRIRLILEEVAEVETAIANRDLANLPVSWPTWCTWSSARRSSTAFRSTQCSPKCTGRTCPSSDQMECQSYARTARSSNHSASSRLTSLRYWTVRSPNIAAW